MNEIEFWELILRSRDALKEGKTEGNLARQAKKLSKLLKKKSKQDLKDFNRIFSEKVEGAYSWDLWGAAFIINDGICTDSMFSFFRNWLVSLGEEAYNQAIAGPDSLSLQVQEKTYEDVNFEEFDLVAEEVYEKKYKSYIDDDEESDSVGFDLESLDREPVGDKWIAESVYELFPQLSKIYS